MSTPVLRHPSVGFILVTLTLAILSSGLIVPVLPGLLVQFAAGDIAEGARLLGLMGAVYSLVQFAALPTLGVLSDCLGRRPMIFIALAGLTVDLLAMAFAPSLGWLLAGRVVSALTGGTLLPVNTYIIDVTPPEKRARSFVLMGAAMSLGNVIGPVLGGLLGHVDLRLPFFVAAGCVGVNLVFTLVLPESLPRERRRAFTWKCANPITALLGLRQFRGMFGLVGIYLLFVGSTIMQQAVWVLYTTFRYEWSVREIGLSLTCVGLVGVLVQGRLLGPILARTGEKRGLVIGLIAFMVALSGYGLAARGWIFCGLIGIAAFAGLIVPCVQTLMTRRVPSDQQGALQGALASLVSLVRILAPALATWSLSECIAPDSSWPMPGIAFFEAAILCMVALFLAWRVFRIDEGVKRDTHFSISPASRSG